MLSCRWKQFCASLDKICATGNALLLLETILCEFGQICVTGNALLVSLSLNYIKQNQLKDTLHWTPLFTKEKFHIHEYDIPLDRVGHC